MRGKITCFLSEKKTLNFPFRPEKAFGFRRRPFFFIWRSPNFHWKIASIQCKNNENLGQVRFRINGSTFQKSPSFAKSWLRACSSLRFRQRWKSVPPCKILQFKYCFKLNYDWLVFFDTQQVELLTMPNVKIIQFLMQKTVFFLVCFFQILSAKLATLLVLFFAYDLLNSFFFWGGGRFHD